MRLVGPGRIPSWSRRSSQCGTPTTWTGGSACSIARPTRLVTEYLLFGITENEIRDHFGIDHAVEPIDGQSVSDADLPWLQSYLHGVTLDLMRCSAFVCVFAKGSD
jgi:hypothetical protein